MSQVRVLLAALLLFFVSDFSEYDGFLLFFVRRRTPLSMSMPNMICSSAREQNFFRDAESSVIPFSVLILVVSGL